MALRIRHLSWAILAVWELPQNLLGAALFLIKCLQSRPSVELRGNRMLIRSDIGISLGSFVFWMCDPDDKTFTLSDVNKYHEIGHSIQSLALGPAYLAVVGIPSAARAVYARIYYRLKKKRWEGYYKGFPESWADRLGGVDSTLGVRLTEGPAEP
jgi:hypothetical protein